MPVTCPKCDTLNPPDSKYCKECSASLLSIRGKDPSDAKPNDVGTSPKADHSSKDIPESFTKTLETPHQELKRGILFAGRYDVIEELGKGGMGKVYRVEDTKIKEEVALKLIKPEIAADKKIIERFRAELKIARKIRHKNVCGMFDLGEEKGTHYITMEYVPGVTCFFIKKRNKNCCFFFCK